MDVNGRKIKAFIDTGAFATIISDTVFFEVYKNKRPVLTKFTGNVLDAGGHSISILGTVKTQVTTPAGSFNTSVLIFKKTKAVEHDILLGMNALQHTNIDFNTRQLRFTSSFPSVANRINDLQLIISDTAIHGLHKSSASPNTNQLTASKQGCGESAAEPAALQQEDNSTEVNRNDNEVNNNEVNKNESTAREFNQRLNSTRKRPVYNYI